MTISSFAEANTALEAFIPRPYKSAEVYSLDTIQKLMEFLGNPQDKLKIIHVAGTSGKTSTSYYCAALLTAAGHKVGLTVSPHVDEINERVQINMVPMPEKEFCAELTEFINLLADINLKPTYYELLIAFAYWEFVREQVEYAVIEVGLGGLLDSSNVAGRPDKICLITDIGLDHTMVLGGTVEEIAAQKAGIVYESNQVFMYQQGSGIMAVVEKTVREKHATLTVLLDYAAVKNNELPLFQQRNLGLASQAVAFALQRDQQPALTDQQIAEAAKTYIPARMETITLPSGQLLIMDGAHNGQKISTLMKSLRTRYPEAAVTALSAFVRSAGDNRWQQGLDSILPEVEAIILTEFKAGQDIPRPSVEAKEIEAYIKAKNFSNVETRVNPEEALRELRGRSTDILLIIGSFHLLNVLRPHILNR